MLNKRFMRSVPLPEDLTNDDIFQAMRDTQNFFTTIRENAGINLSSIVQANNFSGIVSNVFTKKLSDISLYHSYHDQRYPDLMYASKHIGLEVKATNKALKGGEGHNGHSGWHIIVCYIILDSGDIEFTQVEIANLVGYELDNSDWTYQGSQRNKNESQRTETYVTTYVGTMKLRDGTAYLNPDYVTISPVLYGHRRKLSGLLPIPPYSPFADL